MRAIKILYALVIFLFTFTTNLWAASISIINIPSTITDQQFSITASISGATSGTNFLKADIFKDGTSNYFGETYNGSSWYSGGVGNSYFPITIDSSNVGLATFQARVGLPNSNDYPGSGVYKVKIRLYNSSGTASINDTQTPAVVTINYTAPTPSSTPTVTPSPTLTNTPTPTLKPTTPTPSPISMQARTTVVSVSPSQNQQVQGQTSQNNMFAIPTGVKEKDKDIQAFSLSDQEIISKIFISLGVVFMTACAIVIFYPKIDLLIKQRIHE